MAYYTKILLFSKITYECLIVNSQASWGEIWGLSFSQSMSPQFGSVKGFESFTWIWYNVLFILKLRLLPATMIS